MLYVQPACDSVVDWKRQDFFENALVTLPSSLFSLTNTYQRQSMSQSNNVNGVSDQMAGMSMNGSAKPAGSYVPPHVRRGEAQP